MSDASPVGTLGPQPARIDPPEPAATVPVRALRDHHGPAGMVARGDRYQRSADDAAKLIADGIVEADAAHTVKRRGAKG